MKLKTTKEKQGHLLKLSESKILTKAEMSREVGVTFRTIEKWFKKPEFIKLHKEAQAKFTERRQRQIEEAIEKKINGFTVTETKEEFDGNGLLKSKITTQKHIIPSDAMIIFTACNEMPDKYQNTQRVEHKEIDPVTKIEIEIVRPDQKMLDKKAKLLNEGK